MTINSNMVRYLQVQRRTDTLTPKPVHTTAIQHHGLFGPTYVRQHMMQDDNWKNEDLIEEYERITKLLKRHLKYQDMEKKRVQTNLYEESKMLRSQVQAGRSQLQMAREGDVQHELRLILTNHKDMQRLYAQMPLQDVVENITQRTFRMQKERDRWQCHLTRMGKDMEKKKMIKAHLENRLSYLNEFYLQEELALRDLNKQVQNSHTRLQSLQTINGTYQKIVQILKHDEKYHEPILDALTQDIEDQQTFIDHVVHIGTPAIERLQQLKHESWQSDEKRRHQRQSKRSWVSEMQRVSVQVYKASSMQVNRPLLTWKKRYVRETSSMMKIKNQLQEMEKKIRQVQEATLCSRPETIYPTFKQQSALNSQLEKKISRHDLNSAHLQYTAENSAHKKQSLLDEFSGLSQKREDQIERLKELIEEQELTESQCLRSLKENANIVVVLRCVLWNLYDILRHVHLKRDSHSKSIKYPKSYMTLPLLKFEQMEMKAVPPQDFEENISKLLSIITQKLAKLMTAHQDLQHIFEEDPANHTTQNRQKYCSEYLATSQWEDHHGDVNAIELEKSRTLESPKPDLTVPSRSFIKDLSAKLLYTNLHQDD